MRRFCRCGGLEGEGTRGSRRTLKLSTAAERAAWVASPCTATAFHPARFSEASCDPLQPAPVASRERRPLSGAHGGCMGAAAPAAASCCMLPTRKRNPACSPKA